LLKEKIMGQDQTTQKNDIDWENRVLCGDGNCIGVIGTDGRCKECGLIKSDQVGEDEVVYDPGNEKNDPYEDQGSSDTDEEGELPEPSEPDVRGRDMDAEWENRILCSDESCIGTMGPEGICNECGKPLTR
jgi:hypothetical protein